MGWFSYVFALYTFVTFFLRVALFCVTQTGISCLRSLHVMGWFSYLFALYTFVTLLKDISDLFFFLIQFSCIYLSTFVTCH